MGWRTDAPFHRGNTWFNGEPILTPPSGQFMGGFNIEGMEYEFEDSQLPNGGYGTGLTVRCRVVRNSGTYNILPGQLVYFGTTRWGDNQPVLLGTNAAGISNVEAQYCYPADEFLPPGGVPPGDLFYVVTNGPCLVKTAATLTGAESVNIAVGQKVVSATGSATTDGNQGAIIAQDIASATSDNGLTLAGQINNAIGRAMSATTTTQTGTSILVAVGW
jgi:hypothetical protein